MATFSTRATTNNLSATVTSHAAGVRLEIAGGAEELALVFLQLDRDGRNDELADNLMVALRDATRKEI